MGDYRFEIVSFPGDCGEWEGDWYYVIPTNLSVSEVTEDMARDLTVAQPYFVSRW